MTATASPHCLSVRSFFETVAWQQAPVVSQSSWTVEAESTDWRCTSLSHFFGDIDWARRRKNFAEIHTPIQVVHPMAMPVGHFFREFGQQASRKYST